MDMIYLEQPIFVLLPVILLAWQLFLWFLKKKTALSPLAEILLTGLGVAGHTAAITAILMCGGTLSDALVLVLLSGGLSLLLSPTPTKKGEE